MRRTTFVLLIAIAACEENEAIIPTQVTWMEWPANVAAGDAFRTRLVTWGVCALNPRFHAGATADESAVTFAPYFTADKGNIACVQERVTVVALGAFDTAGTAPGLGADSPRTYEMRAAANVHTVVPVMGETAASRTFGDVTVLPFPPPPGPPSPYPHLNVGGWARIVIDTLGCARISPSGLYSTKPGVALANQNDSTGLTARFVRGYVTDGEQTVCGETTLFYLLSKD